MSVDIDFAISHLFRIQCYLCATGVTASATNRVSFVCTPVFPTPPCMKALHPVPSPAPPMMSRCSFASDRQRASASSRSQTACDPTCAGNRRSSLVVILANENYLNSSISRALQAPAVFLTVNSFVCRRSSNLFASTSSENTRGLERWQI